MFNKIKFSIFDKIVKKIVDIFFYFKFVKNYNLSFYQTKQEEKYKLLDLDRNLGLQKLNQLKKNYSFLDYGMSSEHQTLFCSFSEKKNLLIKNILEIGTYDAKNAFLLSKLFPNSKIDTIDLEDNNEIFKKSYSRSDENLRKKFIEERNKLLEKSKNINFIQKNSLYLTFEDKKKYDLIWIDGAHGYPFVTIDIINAIKLIDSTGIVLCDDIFTKSVKENNLYKSNAGHETLNELKKSNLITFVLFYKRLDRSFNAIPNERKFIAYIKKNKF